MKDRIHVLSYPTTGFVYEKLAEAEAEVYLPEYVVKAVKEHADLIGGKVSVELWWPYVYIYIEKDVGKEVEACFEDAWREAEKDAVALCTERCGDDKNCHEECMDELRYDTYKGCRESVGDELRPKVVRAIHDLERIFRLYGIEAEVGERWYGDILAVEAKLTGYRMPILMDAGITILMRVVGASMAKSYRDREKLTYKLTSALYRHLSENQIFELAKHLDDNNIHITRMLDNYNDVRRYEMVITYKDIKIVLYVTEEKDGNYWVVTDVNVGYVEQAVADLTPA
jgi:hypothetical protein